MSSAGFLVMLWSLLLVALLTSPLVSSEAVGAAWIRDTIRLALLYYGVSLVLVLRGRRSLARVGWTLAWLAYVIHVGVAFHFYHGWSHRHAYEHVREASGFGEGIFVSYFFTLLWTADVACWWIKPRVYQNRPRWVVVSVYGFSLFMVFNATVVYETGFIRWAGVALFEVLARQGVASTTTARPQED